MSLVSSPESATMGRKWDSQGFMGRIRGHLVNWEWLGDSMREDPAGAFLGAAVL